MTVAAARVKGVKVNDQIAKDQSRRIAAFLQENAERALENDGLPGGVDTVSYILLGMAADGYPSDPDYRRLGAVCEEQSVSGWPLEVPARCGRRSSRAISR